MYGSLLELRGADDHYLVMTHERRSLLSTDASTFFPWMEGSRVHAGAGAGRVVRSAASLPGRRTRCEPLANLWIPGSRAREDSAVETYVHGVTGRRGSAWQI